MSNWLATVFAVFISCVWTIDQSRSQARTKFGCIVGEEKYDASVGRCRPMPPADRQPAQQGTPAQTPAPSMTEERARALLLQCHSKASPEVRMKACDEVVSHYLSIDPPRLTNAERAFGASGYMGRGDALLAQSKSREAEAELNRSIQIWPAADNYAYCIRAWGHLGEAQHILGILDSDKCVANYPNSFIAWATRGLLFEGRGDLDAAIVDFTRALQIDQPAWVFAARGESYLRKGMYFEANADFSAAISRNSKPIASAYVGRGRSFYGLKRWEEAVQDFTSAITVEQGKSEAFEWRARALFILGKSGNAAADVERVLQLEPHSPAALVIRGIIHESSGSTREAIQDYDAALKYFPRKPERDRERDENAQSYAKRRITELANAKPEESQRRQSGSGFFVSASGHVLTNAHVIEGCKVVTVQQPGGRNERAQIVASDRTNDLALLKASPTAFFAHLSDDARTGEPIATFGFPFAGTLTSSGNFSLGNVSATAGLGDDSRMLQISAPVQAGNSGGPLLDASGNIVGVVVSKLNAIAMLKASGDLPQNVNFAIKSSVARTFLAARGVPAVVGRFSQPLGATDLAEKAKSIAVFVSCSE